MGDLEHDELSPARQAMVREHLSARLDPQAGRAEAHFRQFLAREQSPAEPRHSIFRIPNRFNGWTLGLVGAALAASLAALWAGPSLGPVTPQTPTPTPVMPRVTQVNSPVLIQQDVQSQTYDDGTYMTNDNTPMRVLHRRDLERTRVFDQNQKLQGEQVVPQDHVIYVPMKTY